MCNVSVVRQMEIHAAEPLVPGPGDQIMTEMIQAGGETLVYNPQTY
jgi:hypothetical protein